MKTRQQKSAPQAAHPAAAPPSKRVLVIDDNKEAADTIRGMLELEGHKAQCAYDGKGGMALAQTFQPEVVLVDIGLPGMTGYEVAKNIRMLQTGPAFKLVAITGYAYLEKHIAAAGFDGYKLKPVSYEHLREFLY